LPLKDRRALTDHWGMMLVRPALATAVAAAALLVGAGGLADAAAVDTSELVRTLATDGARLVAQEHELLVMSRQGSDLSPSELAEARSTLRTVDAAAFDVMHQLDLLGVDLSNAVRATMARLPLPPDANPAGSSTELPPPPVVYEAAIDDLMRIAATPAASTPRSESGDGDSNTFGLLAVAAVALLALGLAALSNTLRRSDDENDLAAMAWSDGLTGVANRRRLDRDLAAHSGDGPTAVIMLDVDHFKQVNDRYGHQVGDDVLRSIGSLLAENVRHDDVVYRYGGEEFCILLPDATGDDARTIADRIVAAARAIVLPDGKHITVSVGVADGEAEQVVSTLETADRALYAAKSGGRDRASTAATETLEAV
jgi:diguanylate cyclase (GGDEF)-like protein